MIGDVINLLLLVGAAVLMVLAYRYGRAERAQKRAQRVDLAQQRVDTVEQSEAKQDAIDGALRGSDPATALADLGNRRQL
jgi:hypothetical protein